MVKISKEAEQRLSNKLEEIRKELQEFNAEENFENP